MSRSLSWPTKRKEGHTGAVANKGAQANKPEMLVNPDNYVKRRDSSAKNLHVKKSNSKSEEKEKEERERGRGALSARVKQQEKEREKRKDAEREFIRSQRLKALPQQTSSAASPILVPALVALRETRLSSKRRSGSPGELIETRMESTSLQQQDMLEKADNSGSNVRDSTQKGDCSDGAAVIEDTRLTPPRRQRRKRKRNSFFTPSKFDVTKSQATIESQRKVRMLLGESTNLGEEVNTTWKTEGSPVSANAKRSFRKRSKWKYTEEVNGLDSDNDSATSDDGGREELEDENHRIIEVRRCHDASLENPVYEVMDVSNEEEDGQRSDNMFVSDNEKVEKKREIGQTKLMCSEVGFKNVTVIPTAGPTPRTLPMESADTTLFTERNCTLLREEDALSIPESTFRLLVGDCQFLVGSDAVVASGYCWWMSMRWLLKERKMPFETIDARTAAVDIEMDTYLQHEPATEIISESNGTVKESAFPTHESPVTSELDAGSSGLRTRTRIFRPFRFSYLDRDDGEELLNMALEALFLESARQVFQLNSVKEARDRLSSSRIVLSIPDLYHRSDVVLLVDLLVRRLKVPAVLLHQSSVLSAFGAGVTSCCVVDIGHEKTAISCVEDGVSLRQSRLHCPYGGADLTVLLSRFLETSRAHYWPTEYCDMSSLGHEMTIETIKEQHCGFAEHLFTKAITATFPGSLRRGRVEVGFNASDALYLVFSGVLCTECTDHCIVADNRSNSLDRTGEEAHRADDPCSYPYYNSIKAKNPKAKRKKASPSTSTSSPSQAAGTVEPNTVNFSEIASKKLRSTKKKKERETQRSAEHCHQQATQDTTDRHDILPLHIAIYRSISLCGGASVQRKMYANILLTGGSSQFENLDDVVVRRLCPLLPTEIKAEDVLTVVSSRDIEPSDQSWRGGCVLANLDMANECWLLREEWLTGGVRELREHTPFKW